MEQRLKIGVIGLGAIAQIVHLPILSTWRDKFQITAICDVSPQLVAAIAKQYNVATTYNHAEQLMADPNVDAVFILNSDEYHADYTVAALEHGKHVFVEKPIALHEADIQRIIQAEQATNKKVMVGYMRRYAPAFKQALKEVRQMKQINYARFRDIIGYNHFFVNQTQQLYRFDDVAETAVQDRAERANVQIQQALGADAEQYGNTYRWMSGLCSHDFSAMRELLGMPNRVIAATPWSEQNFMNVLFEYDGFHVIYEVGFDKQIRFDAMFEIFGEQKTVLVNYDSGYIRHLPTTITIEQSDEASFSTTTSRPTYTDPYTLELLQFYKAIQHGEAFSTTASDALDDVKLFQMIIEAIKRNQ